MNLPSGKDIPEGLRRYQALPKSEKQARTGKSGKFRAGLLFPIGRCKSMLRKGRYAKRISSDAGVFMAGALQYLASEILEMAGEASHQQKMKRIKPQHIMTAIRGDDELSKMMAYTTCSEGGFKK